MVRGWPRGGIYGLWERFEATIYHERLERLVYGLSGAILGCRGEGKGSMVSGVLESASGGSVFESAVGAVPGCVVVVICWYWSLREHGTWRSTLC